MDSNLLVGHQAYWKRGIWWAKGGFKSVRRFLAHPRDGIQKIQANVLFVWAHRKVRGRRKIIHAITPPPWYSNVGDHAQVVAIRAWIEKHFPGLPVIEVDKDQAKQLLYGLRWLVQPNDIIFLHSGGNLGDRGIWSERIRRTLIDTFRNNRIVSLPQTIYFSDSPLGRKEREKSIQIYARHKKLTIIGRDPRSAEIAREMFPTAQVLCMPDFVLSIAWNGRAEVSGGRQKLLCLRSDKESILNESESKAIAEELGDSLIRYDTHVPDPINVDQREMVLRRTLELFSGSEVVVTDKFHGVIFAVLCRKPCVVLRTVDHKLTSGMHWFREVKFVVAASGPGSVADAVERAMCAEGCMVPDWNELYFDRLPRLLGLDGIES